MPHRPQPSIFPERLNLGSGKDFRDDFFNIDVDETWAPDAVYDISAVTDLAAGVSLQTSRFGAVTLLPDSFDLIVANDVLEHVPDLASMMTACLQLLRLGGSFKISVPYDLSYGAWQDPTHVRAFNERSWLYYTDWFWYMGWSEFRFALQTLDFVPSLVGQGLKERGVARDEILRTPRAIDSMTVSLQKIALTPGDRVVFQASGKGGRRGAPRATDLHPTTSTQEDAAPKAFEGTFEAQRDRYAIWIVTPNAYEHQHAYDEVASGLSAAFEELGGSAPVVRDPTDANGRTLIIFGSQLLPASALALLPKSCILFNLEQAQAGSPWMTGTYLALLKRHPVLDYSVRNQAALRSFGVDHARHLPLGYARGLSRIQDREEKDIDVLFYGSLNERRRVILEHLKARGVSVVHLFGVYDAERDAMIARAKIVLNLHFYESAIFEVVRVGFLLANKVCVVTEGNESDPDLEAFKGGMAVSAYVDLVDRCTALLADPQARETLALAGLDAMKRRPQSMLLRHLFEG